MGHVNHLILENKIRSPDLLMTSLICIEQEYPSVQVFPQFPHDLISWHAMPRALTPGSYLNPLRYFLPMETVSILGLVSLYYYLPMLICTF